LKKLPGSIVVSGPQRSPIRTMLHFQGSGRWHPDGSRHIIAVLFFVVGKIFNYLDCRRDNDWSGMDHIDRKEKLGGTG
jgi:hypothetical protein